MHVFCAVDSLSYPILISLLMLITIHRYEGENRECLAVTIELIDHVSSSYDE